MTVENSIAPPTDKQMVYACKIAIALGTNIPDEAKTNRATISDWIGEHQNRFLMRPRSSGNGGRATSRQVGFAEQIARGRRLTVPRECFLNARLMSNWIDTNKPTGKRVAQKQEH